MTVAFTNFASTRTTSILLAGGTSFSVTPGSGANFPATAGGAWFYLVLTDSLTAPTVREVIKVTNRSTDSMATIIRAQDGTSAVEWPSGSYCELRLTKGALADIQGVLATALQVANNLADVASVITARSNLGLGSMAVQSAGAVSISGGAIGGVQITGGTLDITPVGSISPSTGSFTTLAASGAVSGAGFVSRFSAPGPIGDGTSSTGAFTTLAASGIFTASTDSYFAGVLYGSGNGSFSPPVADGKFVLQSATADGAMLYGRGSTNDVSIYNRDGSVGLFFRTADISIGTTDFLPNADNTTTLGSASYRFKNAFFSGQVKGGAGTGTGAPVMIGTLSVNTTAVGNVGAGTDDLMTYSLPANSLSANGKGVRITAWGTIANNANAKSVYLLFGGSALAAPSVTVNQLAYWRYEAIVIRTGSNAQQYQVTFENGRTALLDFARDKSALAKTDTADIIIKCTGTATADNDIVQEGMIVEFFN